MTLPIVELFIVRLFLPSKGSANLRVFESAMLGLEFLARGAREIQLSYRTGHICGRVVVVSPAIDEWYTRLSSGELHSIMGWH